MTLEREIKEALRRHEGDAQPAPGAWREVERRVGRRHRRRVAAMAVGSAAAVLAAGLAIPRLGARPAPRFDVPAPTTPASPTPDPSPDPTAGWGSYRDDRAGFQFRLPADWRVMRFEGVTEAVPPGLPGSISGEPTFSIAIEPTAVAGRTASGEAPGAEWGEPETGTHYGRPFSRWTRADAEQSSTLILFDWPAAPDADGSPCRAPDPCRPSGIQVIVTASTGALRDAHATVGETIVSTLAPASGEAPPDHRFDVRTPRGTVSAGVPYDAATATVVLFLESRVDGVQAERYLTENAQRQFDERAGGLGLYGSDPDSAYFRYEIVERAGVDASSFEYTVRLTTVAGDSEWVVEEILGAGPGDSPRGQGTAIRFAQFVRRTP